MLLTHVGVSQGQRRKHQEQHDNTTDGDEYTRRYRNILCFRWVNRRQCKALNQGGRNHAVQQQHVRLILCGCVTELVAIRLSNILVVFFNTLEYANRHAIILPSPRAAELRFARRLHADTVTGHAMVFAVEIFIVITTNLKFRLWW